MITKVGWLIGRLRNSAAGHVRRGSCSGQRTHRSNSRGSIVFSNDAGCRLVLVRKDGQYGLGTFYFNDVALGSPIDHFLTETISVTTRRILSSGSGQEPGNPDSEPLPSRFWKTATTGE